MVFRTTDANKKFHLLGTGLSSSEKTEDFSFFCKPPHMSIFKNFNYLFFPTHLVADGSLSSHNAFREVFRNDPKVVMCWAHKKRACEKSLKSKLIDKSLKDVFITYISLIHYSKSYEDFEGQNFFNKM